MVLDYSKVAILCPVYFINASFYNIYYYMYYITIVYLLK